MMLEAQRGWHPEGSDRELQFRESPCQGLSLFSSNGRGQRYPTLHTNVKPAYSHRLQQYAAYRGKYLHTGLLLEHKLLFFSIISKHGLLFEQLVDIHYFGGRDQRVRLDMASYKKTSAIRGHHIYKSIWVPVIVEESSIQWEDSNIHDKHAITVIKDNYIVRQVTCSTSHVLVLRPQS